MCASGFVYFYTFHGLRAVFRDGTQKHSAWKDLGLGAVAGAINVLATTPLWVVNTRIKMQGVKLRQGDESLRNHPKYDGILDGLTKIVKFEGIGTLWASTLPSLMLVSNPAIQFAIYEALKRRLTNLLGTDTLSMGNVFLLGALSKSISTVITYPLQLVQSKSRVSLLKHV